MSSIFTETREFPESIIREEFYSGFSFSSLRKYKMTVLSIKYRFTKRRTWHGPRTRPSTLGTRVAVFLIATDFLPSPFFFLLPFFLLWTTLSEETIVTYRGPYVWEGLLFPQSTDKTIKKEDAVFTVTGFTILLNNVFDVKYLLMYSILCPIQ